MKKPWSGRFRSGTSRSVEAFTESVSFDKKLWKHDIRGSIAHAEMLGQKRIIPKKDAARIVKGLKKISADIEKGKFVFRPELEDVHMNIEAELTRRTGASGKKLHTARSRNDQVALDLRLYLREETGAIIRRIRDLQRALLKAADKHLGTVMPGYTHLQRAQPVLLGHHLMAYVEMLQRDAERFRDSLKRINVMPLGACALAGTSLPIDRGLTAKKLGFASATANSIDSVSDRDFALEFLACASILMMHLSRFCEELVLWSTEEFRFIEISDEFTTGSSIMPQKKNPDVAELVRGKTGRVYGSLVALLTLMKALPLAYNRDMQEDKPPVFDATQTVQSCLSVLADMLPKIGFRPARMAATAGEGYSTATDIAEYLVRKGMPFREAHEVTGRIVLHCIRNGIANLSDLGMKDFRQFSALFRPDVRKVLDPADSVASRASAGGTSRREVKKQISRYRRMLS